MVHWFPENDPDLCRILLGNVQSAPRGVQQGLQRD